MPTNEPIRPVNFERLESKLRSDASFRGIFMDDPVGALRREGITLSARQQRLLTQAVTKLRSTPGSMNHPDIGIVLTPSIGDNAFIWFRSPGSKNEAYESY